jgi:ABC-type lipoprotein export system ATPase subunit
MTQVLSIEAVSVCHWRGQRPLPALRDVSMTINRGELAGLHAKAGGGKTTLLEVAGGLLCPDAGRVTVAGVELSTLSARDLRTHVARHVGFATRQGPDIAGLPMVAWLEMAVMSRIGRAGARRRAREVLDRVGAGGTFDQPWSSLSNREQILASIARAVVTGPQLLLVDEHAAGLDLFETMEVLGLLRSLATTAGTAVLVTASELLDLQGVDSIWMLKDGYLTEPDRTSAPVIRFPDRASQA